MQIQPLLKALNLPKLYERDDVDEYSILIEYKFLLKEPMPGKLFGAFQWFIKEYDEENNEAFGFCNLNDPEMAELGYVSITEIEDLNLPLSIKKFPSPKTLTECKSMLV